MNTSTISKIALSIINILSYLKSFFINQIIETKQEIDNINTQVQQIDNNITFLKTQDTNIQQSIEQIEKQLENVEKHIETNK
jgi:chromosome segregation ATPase